MKFLLFIFLFVFHLSYSSEEDVSSWFKQESEQFLLIMNNSKGEDNENYDNYSLFIEKNFAIKSIAYGLVPESVLSKSDENDIERYIESFKKYLTNTIYNLSNNRTSGTVELVDIDYDGSIYQIKSNISDGDNSVSLYWKVALIKSEFKILDVIVENTSYFVTKKAEFTKLLRKFNGDLRKLTEEIDKI